MTRSLRCTPRRSHDFGLRLTVARRELQRVLARVLRMPPKFLHKHLHKHLLRHRLSNSLRLRLHPLVRIDHRTRDAHAERATAVESVSVPFQAIT